MVFPPEPFSKGHPAGVLIRLRTGLRQFTQTLKAYECIRALLIEARQHDPEADPPACHFVETLPSYRADQEAEAALRGINDPRDYRKVLKCKIKISESYRMQFRKIVFKKQQEIYYSLSAEYVRVQEATNLLRKHISCGVPLESVLQILLKIISRK